jgi:hypothetical protein
MPLELFEDPASFRKDAAMLRRAIANGWMVPESTVEAVVKILPTLLECEDPAVVLGTCRLIAELRRDDLAKYVALDKINRLNAGMPTEHVLFIPPEARQAAVEAIASLREPSSPSTPRH